MKIKQTQKLSQKLALTPKMKQSIRILQMPILQLKGYLEAQIEINPALEEQKPIENLKQPLYEQTIKEFLALSQIHERNINYNSPDYSSQELQNKQDYRESLITKKPGLQEHLCNNCASII